MYFIHISILFSITNYCLLNSIFFLSQDFSPKKHIFKERLKGKGGN